MWNVRLCFEEKQTKKNNNDGLIAFYREKDRILNST
jgi:hypothetical protein